MSEPAKAAEPKSEARRNAKLAERSKPLRKNDAASASGPLGFLLLFLPYCAFLTWYSAKLHYDLPEPVQALYSPTTGLPQFSEAQAHHHVWEYAERIGYRIVGMPEMDEAVDYTLKYVKGLQREVTRPSVQIEVEHQKGNGQHLFDFMGKKVWKKYHGISNVVVRLSNGTNAGKENAILVNAHLDSTLPSPGAADDAAGIAIMLETLRVMAHHPSTHLNNAIVFLFNGAEETLQDASHLFITQHPWRHTIRGVVNLEACGTAGAEMLFQATSIEMLKAYAKTPRPMGTVMATELFSTGLIVSDTDFRQFEQYGGLTGLDMALVQDSYKYHTRLDSIKFLQKGALQHFGDNILAILTHLATIPTPSDLQNIKKSKDTVFFTALGGHVLVLMSASKATGVYVALLVATLTIFYHKMRRDRLAGYVYVFLSIPLSLLSGVLAANLAAFMMASVLHKPLSHFRVEWWCILLYEPPALVGIAICQYLTSWFLASRGHFRPGEGLLQHAVLLSTLLFTSTLGLVGHLLDILSSYIFGIASLSLLVMLIFNDYILAPNTKDPNRRGVTTFSYMVGQTIALLNGSEGILGFLDVIIPLTGRLGPEAPSDHVAASLVSSVLFLIIITFPALCHRWGSRILAQSILLYLFATTIIMAMFAAPSWQPFDAEHPKRVLCLYMENITSNELTLHIGNIDPSISLFEDILSETTSQLQLEGKPVKSEISEDIPDWDIIYPVGQYIHSYKVPLPHADSSYTSSFKKSFRVEVLDSRLNAVKQQRSLTVALNHPNIIWTVMAFVADVVSWDLPAPAERGSRRHHVKEASGYGVSTWRISLTVQLGNDEFQAALRQSQRRKGQRPKGDAAEIADTLLGGLRIDFSGLDANRMWREKDNHNRPGMQFVSRLDKLLPEWTDPMLLTAVSGVAVV